MKQQLANKEENHNDRIIPLMEWSGHFTKLNITFWLLCANVMYALTSSSLTMKSTEAAKTLCTILVLIPL